MNPALPMNVKTDKLCQKILDLEKGGKLCGKNPAQVARTLHTDRDKVRRRMAKLAEMGRIAPRVVTERLSSGNSRTKKVIVGSCSTEDFIKPFDVEAQVAEAIETSLRGKVIEDEDFRRFLGVSTIRWRELRRTQRFFANQLLVKNKTTCQRIWGPVEEIAKCRKRIVMTTDVK